LDSLLYATLEHGLGKHELIIYSGKVSLDRGFVTQPFLKHREMKDIMDFGGWGKSQAISHRTNLGNNAVGAKKSGGEFLVGPLAEGVLAIVVQAQIDPVPGKKFPLCVLLIINMLHAILCAK